MIKYFILCLSTILFSCVGERNKTLQSVGVEPQITQEVIKPEPIAEKDSIDSLIELRAKQKFNHTIFAGLRFGDNPQKVKTVLQNIANRKIKVPNGDKVSTIYVKDYDAEYYRGQLASLRLYADESDLDSPLRELFSTKYGKTKGVEWIYEDCDICVCWGWRKEYNPSRDAGYASGAGTHMYYKSYHGERTEYLTKDPCFLKIVYNNLRLTKLIERDKFVKDSLNQVETLKKIQAEKELAEKLRTVPATNI